MKNLCYSHHLNMKISVEPIITSFELQRTEACSFRLLYILSRVPVDPMNPKMPANLKSQKFQKNVQINLTLEVKLIQPLNSKFFNSTFSPNYSCTPIPIGIF